MRLLRTIHGGITITADTEKMSLIQESES